MRCTSWKSAGILTLNDNVKWRLLKYTKVLWKRWTQWREMGTTWETTDDCFICGSLYWPQHWVLQEWGFTNKSFEAPKSPQIHAIRANLNEVSSLQEAVTTCVTLTLILSLTVWMQVHVHIHIYIYIYIYHPGRTRFKHMVSVRRKFLTTAPRPF